jgi:hypothetical protein
MSTIFSPKHKGSQKDETICSCLGNNFCNISLLKLRILTEIINQTHVIIKLGRFSEFLKLCNIRIVLFLIFKNSQQKIRNILSNMLNNYLENFDCIKNILKCVSMS